MSNKKNLVIFANCFGSQLKYMLEKYYGDIYNIYYHVNYDIINNNKDLPSDFLNADYFLYQNYSDKPDSIYDLKNILNKILKPECIKLCFPTLHACNLIFAYDIKCDENNKYTISEEYPFGKFFFGIKPLIDLCNKYKNEYSNKKLLIDKIIEDCLKDNFISEEEIIYYKNRTFEFLQNKILSSDVPELYDFIKNNYIKQRLWHNPNHPTGILIQELDTLIFRKLNLEVNFDEVDMFKLENSLSDWVMPIFPCVKKYYNFEFDCNKCSSWYNKEILDLESYVMSYISYFINM
jgi:hypothetical protein